MTCRGPTTYEVDRKNGCGWQPVSKNEARELLSQVNGRPTLRHIGRYTTVRMYDWDLRRVPR